jgi:hypothetical protein
MARGMFSIQVPPFRYPGLSVSVYFIHRKHGTNHGPYLRQLTSGHRAQQGFRQRKYPYAASNADRLSKVILSFL